MPSKPRVSTHPAKQRTATSKRLIERVRAICMALPDATEQLAWGEPTWRVNGRIFAQLADHHHGNEHVALWLPAPDGAQQALIDADPARFFRPPYVGGAGWIAVVLETGPDWGMVASLCETAHGLVASKAKRRGQSRASSSRRRLARNRRSGSAPARASASRYAAVASSVRPSRRSRSARAACHR
jgi:hypothetical protein